MLTAAQIVNAPTTLTTPAPSRWEQRVAWAARELGFDAPPPASELQARFVERLSDEQFMPQGSASEAFCTLMADAEGIIEVDDPPPFAHAQHFSLLAKLDALQAELLSLPVGVRRERLARLKAECAHDPWPSARVGLLERHLQVDAETTTRSDEPLRELIAGLIELTTLRPLPRAVRRRELVRSLQRHGNAAGLAQRVSKLHPDVAKLDPWLLVLLEKLPTEVPGERSAASNPGAATRTSFTKKSDAKARETSSQKTARYIGMAMIWLFFIGLGFVVIRTIVDFRAAEYGKGPIPSVNDMPILRPIPPSYVAPTGVDDEDNSSQPLPAPESLRATAEQERARQVEEATARIRQLVKEGQARNEEQRQQDAERTRQSERDPFGTRPIYEGRSREFYEGIRRMEEGSRQRSDQIMRDFEQRRKEREEKYELERKQRDEEFRKQQEETYKRLGIPPPRLPY